MRKRVWQLEEADRQGEAVIRREIGREKGRRGREASFTPKKWKYVYHTIAQCVHIYPPLWGVADCIWDAHTNMQLFVQPDYYGYTGMGSLRLAPGWLSTSLSSSNYMVYTCLKGAVCFVEEWDDTSLSWLLHVCRAQWRCFHCFLLNTRGRHTRYVTQNKLWLINV